MKSIFAFRSDAQVLSPDLRMRLRAAGVHELQVNVDDDAVAAAMLRITTAPDPIAAVVSVWGGDPAAVVDVFTAVDPGVAGWRVDERRPIEPPPIADGVRADALVNVAFLRRPATMAPAQWERDWLERHTPIAIETQQTFGYVQNIVRESLTAATPDVAGIVEEWFPIAAMRDPHEFYGSAGDDAELRQRISRLLTSVARFGADHGIEVVPTSRYRFS